MALMLYLTTLSLLAIGQSEWKRIANFPEKIVGGFSFTIGNNAYVGGGWDPFENKSFYKYNSKLDQWNKLDDFPGSFNGHPISVSVGEFGYVLTGSISSGIASNEVWKYDPINDKWEQLDNFPGPSRFEALGLVANGNIFIGFGYNYELGYLKDFWKYDPILKEWLRIDDFPGTPRLDPIGFSIDSEIYCGLGGDSLNFNNDIWHYNYQSNEWIEMNQFPGLERARSSSFVIKGKAYMGMGMSNDSRLNDFWEYNPEFDTWIELDASVFSPRMFATSFVIEEEGYLGLGTEGADGGFQDIYKVDPDLFHFNSDSTNCEIAIGPNPSSKNFVVKNNSRREGTYINIINSSGKLLLSTTLNSKEIKELEINASGLVLVYLISGNEVLCVKKHVIN